MAVLEQIEDLIAPLGLIVRGGLEPVPEDGVPAATKALVLIGNAGNELWRSFAPHAPVGDHPLDRWTRRVIEPVAVAVGATALYPFGGPPHWPFQRWAKRAGPLHTSPLGLLIHPTFGLWHAYRAALAFDRNLEFAPREEQPSPCDSCADKLCLAACPVAAFGPEGYDVPRCRAHLEGPASQPCFDAGCLARAACPVGRDYAYRPPLARFHMEAFRASGRAR